MMHLCSQHFANVILKQKKNEIYMTNQEKERLQMYNSISIIHLKYRIRKRQSILMNKQDVTPHFH